MKRLICAGTIAGLMSAGFTTSSLAQGVGVYVRPPAASYTYVEPPRRYRYVEPAPVVPGTRVYGYYRRAPVAVAPPVAYGNCGVYHYFNGRRCVDARNDPPDLR
ncbi:MAG: hypothetical protein AB7O43_23030 [Hyphomicrobiaceae bacterium]